MTVAISRSGQGVLASACIFGLTAVLGPLGAQTETPPRIRVGPNVHVSHQLPNAPDRELRVCSSPKDPRDVFVIGNVYLAEENIETVRGYRSRDGGRSWTLAFKPK